MKLKDPLMGIKLMQGHLIMHFTTFLYLAIYVESYLEVTGRNADEYKYITMLKYGHLAVSIMQIVSTFLKIKGYRLIADTL